jgi:hypothetical protein
MIHRQRLPAQLPATTAHTTPPATDTSPPRNPRRRSTLHEPAPLLVVASQGLGWTVLAALNRIHAITPVPI